MNILTIKIDILKKIGGQIRPINHVDPTLICAALAADRDYTTTKLSKPTNYRTMAC
jgi:hypothetical protein